MAILLGDGDVLVYRAGFAAEKTHYAVRQPDDHFVPVENAKAANDLASIHPGSEVWTRKVIEPIENCLSTVKAMITGMVNETKADRYRIFLSGKTNFREQLYSEYKANRASKAKPYHYANIRKYLIEHHRAEVSKDIEADDLIGISAMAYRRDHVPYVISTIDKDLKQIPGNHYNFVTKESECIDDKKALTFFYQQLLSGDPTDNIPGIRGIGDVKARAIVQELGTPWEMAGAVWKAYQEASDMENPTEIIDLQAQLVWVQRSENSEHPFWRHFDEWKVRSKN